ncbi:MAG: saccharopine dehydrogenase C-terminal domain-containing protein [Ginsengibacter sp.]
MNSILIFGAGKSATFLIEYVSRCCDEKNWKLLLCDTNLALAQSKIAGSKNAKAIAADVSDDSERAFLIQQAHVVISMLPPHLHFLVAKDCIQYSKHLLTASYIDDPIRSLKDEIEKKKLLFLCEMGLDPGIDHMSAMKIIDKIKKDGGEITSFKSHCGGLVAPENDDNPWHYKVTWNPGNIVMAGSSGAVYKINGETLELPYTEVFNNCNEVDVPGLFKLAWYANRDSLSYIDKYRLEGVDTFIRTTLRFSSFCRGWNKIVNIGLTSLDDFEEIKNCKTYLHWFDKKISSSAYSDVHSQPGIENKFFDVEFSEQLDYFGIRHDTPIGFEFTCSAAIMQRILETKLVIHAHEKDMIVMLHEIGYKLDGAYKTIVSSLIVKGVDQVHTAMAKTVGLPLGIAAKLIMEGRINLTGLHIPVIPEIYEPVLAELEKNDIKFQETQNSLK